MKKNATNKLLFTILLSAAMLICAVATVYSIKDIQHKSYMERAKSLNLVMSKIGEHLNIAFETKWNRTHYLINRIERMNATSVDDLIDTLNDIYVETESEFKVVDSEGIAYYHNGRQEYWKDHRAVPPKSETFILSPLQFGVTNENYMKYIAPLEKPLEIGKVKIMYAVLTEPLNTLQKDFDTGTYGDGCLSFIIDKNGTFIYENSSGDLMADSYNFFAYIEKAVTFQYGESYARFRDNIDNGENNTVLVEYNGIKYYLSHFDLKMGDWVSVLLVPELNTQAEDSSFTQKLLFDISIVFVAASLLFIIGFLYMWKKTVTNQRMAAEAERRSNEAKTNFLSSMSHDIRTPMNAIVGMTEIALQNTKGVPKPVRDNLEKIRLSSSHLLMLINDILDISKIESGRMSLNISEFSVVEAINTLANIIRPLAKDKNIDLRIHTDNYRQEFLLGDELRICQVCINLATNAIKYTSNGGRVDIDFKQEFPKNAPNMVRLICTVRDNGIGMSDDYQKIMYEVFSRATDSRVNKVEGSGLGLPICKKIVQLMDGTLECESEKGKGTTFTISVFLEKGKPDKQYNLSNMNVLVVDRDTLSTNALKQIFERLDIKSDIINDPSKLGTLLQKDNSYNLAFVNLEAPGNSGLETVKKLRRKFGTDFPVVLTDIADMVEYSEQITSSNVRITMNKPYFYRNVYHTILLSLKKSTTENSSHKGRTYDFLKGTKVLVAEDNGLNWEILSELLKMNGIDAQRAENGKKCVEILEAATPEQFSAVLMDVRMPVMNGLEATRLIRSSNIQWVRTLPIIAMTANAFAEDISACLEAGMNAHLSKPINLNQLFATLSRLSKKSYRRDKYGNSN